MSKKKALSPFLQDLASKITPQNSLIADEMLPSYLGETPKRRLRHFQGGFSMVGKTVHQYTRALHFENCKSHVLLEWLIERCNRHNLVGATYADMAIVLRCSRATAARALQLLVRYQFVRREREGIRINAAISWESKLHPRTHGISAWLAPITISLDAVKVKQESKSVRHTKVSQCSS